MEHLKIEITAVGEPTTAIAQAASLAKKMDQDLYLSFRSWGFTVHKDSNVQDLLLIHDLECKYRDLHASIAKNAK